MLQTLDLGASDDRIKNYAAWAFSAYALAQALSNIVWGRLSDIYGRRTAILGGFIGTFVATLTLALSHNVTMVIISRIMAGALSGNITLVRTMLGEIVSGRENQGVYPFPQTLFCIRIS